MDGPRKIKIPQFGTRHIMVAGGERTPMAITGGTALGFLALAWQFHSIVAVVTALALVCVFMPLLRRLGKRDPRMFAVFRRFIFYRRRYPARPTPFRR